MIKTIYNIKRYILNKIHGLLKTYSQLINILSTKTTVKKKNILRLILKMSAFLALTLKSSRKLASLRKGDRDPRTCVCEVEYLTVDRWEVGLCIDILADFAEQRCDKVLDTIMSLCNKTHLLTRQGVADCESISTRAMARQDCNASVASA